MVGDFGGGEVGRGRLEGRAESCSCNLTLRESSSIVVVPADLATLSSSCEALSLPPLRQHRPSQAQHQQAARHRLAADHCLRNSGPRGRTAVSNIIKQSTSTRSREWRRKPRGGGQCARQERAARPAMASQVKGKALNSPHKQIMRLRTGSLRTLALRRAIDNVFGRRAVFMSSTTCSSTKPSPKSRGSWEPSSS